MEEIDPNIFLNDLSELGKFKLWDQFKLWQQRLDSKQTNVNETICLQNMVEKKYTIIHWIDIGAWISVNHPEIINRFNNLKAFL